MRHVKIDRLYKESLTRKLFDYSLHEFNVVPGDGDVNVDAVNLYFDFKFLILLFLLNAVLVRKLRKGLSIDIEQECLAIIAGPRHKF